MVEKGLMEEIAYRLEEAGIEELSSDGRQLLELYIREVVLWSGRIHLIGKGRIRENLPKLIVDSFLILKFAEEMGILGVGEGGGAAKLSKDSFRENGMGVRVADVGSGAGFPGVVWKIARPGLEVTLFERKRKALLFLERVISILKVKGLRAVEGEAGCYMGENPFDLVVSKAAGRFSDILPVAERLLRGGGAYITVKGSGWKEELEGAGPVGMELEAEERLEEMRGTILIFRKQESGGR